MFRKRESTMRIHCGAHKTATSYLQKRLRENAELLAERGYRYLNHHDVRPRVKRLVAGRTHDDTDIAEFFAPGKGHAVDVFSEEYIVGRCHEIVKTGLLLPLAPDQLRLFSGWFGDRVTDVFFAVRSYDGFLAAAYAEARRGGTYRAFAEFRDSLDLDARGWPDVLRDIASTFPKARLHVWRFEDFREVEPQVLARMFDLDTAGQLRPLQGRVRESPSAEAMRAVDVLAEEFGGKRAVKFMKPAEKVFPKRTGTRYWPWSSDESDELRGRYERDWQAIVASGRYQVI
jgi:hypothetical protein